MSTAPDLERVLVVDDDQASRHLVELALRALDVEVHTCGDPAEVVRLVDELRPAVLVLDVMMPNVDGPMVVEGLRSAQVPMPRLVLWSAVDAARLQELGRATGADRVVLKVAGPNALVQEVGSLLDLWQS